MRRLSNVLYGGSILSFVVFALFIAIGLVLFPTTEPAPDWFVYSVCAAAAGVVAFGGAAIVVDELWGRH